MNSVWSALLVGAIFGLRALEKNLRLRRDKALEATKALKQIEDRVPITKESIEYLLQYDQYLLFKFNTHHAKVKSINTNLKSVTYEIITDPYKGESLGEHRVGYTDETFNALLKVFSEPVFKHKFGADYERFVQLSYSYGIFKAPGDVYGMADIYVTFRIAADKADTKKKKKMRVSRKVPCTVNEFKNLYYKMVTWKEDDA